MSKQRIAIVDYGSGNLRSVYQAVKHVADGHDVVLTSDPAVIDTADRVVFPGQGAIQDCVRHLNEAGVRASVEKAAAERPFLGVCVGMQMLFQHSEEGDTHGLALFKGRSLRFPHGLMVDDAGQKLKVPHMGWNRVKQTRPHALWQGIDDEARFYYCHSYFVHPTDMDLVLGTTDYPFTFCGAVARGSLVAVQFHPEKSDRDGLQLYRNFVTWNGRD